MSTNHAVATTSPLKRILIIEDDELIAKVYGTKYAAAGYETMTALDGAEGLKLLGTFKPDLVHLDLGVPKVNGAEIIRHIRSRPETKSLPVIVLSNTYQNRLVKAAMDAGATECVSKATCTPKMMLEIVEKQRSRMSANPPAPAIRSLRLVPPPPSPQERVPAASSDPGETERHAAFQLEVRDEFLKRAPKMLLALQAGALSLLRADTEASRVEGLSSLCPTAHALEGQAAIAGMQPVSQLSSALVALLRDLLDKPGEILPSSLHTVTDACSFLNVLFEHSAGSPSAATGPVLALVVHDKAHCRRSVCEALAQLNVATICVDKKEMALGLLAQNRFGLILLDAGPSGFELCRELRTQTSNQATPVIFVTSPTEPLDRERSISSGGTDLIADPFLPMELAVKALILLLRKPILDTTFDTRAPLTPLNN